ncbi:hypothetical protein DPEC_G00295830 [Dallia pectoralis]|uniref:Uncharacterized protein n=1 Tax=Dallia pectoralis TaxID=75939 RepID=A0ACC2FJ25_DALPE|nr:hypothetical protein DPEC_G00295830 [Dallia pectoralis]
MVKGSVTESEEKLKKRNREDDERDIPPPYCTPIPAASVPALTLRLYPKLEDHEISPTGFDPPLTSTPLHHPTCIVFIQTGLSLWLLWWPILTHMHNRERRRTATTNGGRRSLSKRPGDRMN